MIITWLLPHYYIHYFYIIITHYYILYYYVLLQNHYYVLLHHYYIIITSLLHHYYFIITKGKSCNNESIITCYAKSKLLLLHHYYVLLRHYYTGFYYYPLLPISVSRTCRWESSSTLKPSRHHRVAFSASSRRAKRVLWRWVFIFIGLAASRVQQCSTLPKTRSPTFGMFRGVGGQSKLRNDRKKRQVIKAALASRARSNLKICQTCWLADD